LDRFALTGRRFVVTGASSGIGRAIAEAFTAAGAEVALLDLNADALAGVALELGSSAAPFVCDVTEEAAVQQTFAAIADAGPIHGLVNSAGISHIGTLLSTSSADFDRLFQVNVRGTFLCMREAVPHLQQRGGGVILNMASIAATSGLPDRFAYSMTKGAVLSMTLATARDFLADGIRCNCISPARVHTPFVDNFLARNYPGREAEMFARLSAAQPVGRMARPAEIALLALYLCSDAASFITGSDMPIDGGFLNLR
jgi:NAD(P)-dependent dehydrogenase (short-subunit alcohol dehydrogenase family)